MIVFAARREGAMLEKLFGKKSTGIVWIVCISILLLMLAGYFLSYVLRGDIAFHQLIGYALYIACSVVFLTLPAFVQKKFKLYIPPFIQTGLCVYAVLSLLNANFRAEQDIVTVSVLPSVGGFFLSAADFSVLLALLQKRADRRGRSVSPTITALLCFACTTLLIFLINLPSVFISIPVPARGNDLLSALALTAACEGGNLIFCAIGWITMHTGKAEKYTVRSFRDPEQAKRDAEREGDRSMLTVVENISRDKTDYKKLYRSARIRFFLARIIFLAFYAVYLVFSVYSFVRLGGIGYAIIVFLGFGFILTAILYLYEYVLYRKNALNQKLRILKIVRTAVRLYTIFLTFIAMFVADYHYRPIAAVASVVMAIFNLCVLFYNLFGKPRKYPSSRRNGDPSGNAEPPSPRQ